MIVKRYDHVPNRIINPLNNGACIERGSMVTMRFLLCLDVVDDGSMENQHESIFSVNFYLKENETAI